MQSAVPTHSSLDKVVDLEMNTGVFPSTGAMLTFTLDQPLPNENTAFIASWDTRNLDWVPQASALSPDRKNVSTKLAHFSTYGLFDIVSNTIGKVVGARTTRPECKNPPPTWDDKSSPQFYDDINGPVLWCATSDPANPDNLEIRLKLNRGAAASFTTAIKPVWTQSDLWGGVTPETWATMVLSGPESLIPKQDTYFIQPTGEFTFRFNKSDLLNFWHSNLTKPLIEVDTTVPDVLAGLLYNEVSNDTSGVPALSFVTTIMAVTQCASDIYTSGGDLALSSTSVKSVVSELPALMGTLSSCLAAQSDSVAQAAAKYWATRNPASTITEIEKKAHFAAKGILVWAQIYAAVQVLAPVADALTDLLLDPIARQFEFQPSDAALKAFLGPAPADLGSVDAPPMCTRPGGQLVNGQQPIPQAPGGPSPGSTALQKNGDGTYLRAVGDSSTKTQGLTALVFQCNKGGVAWPATLAFYSNYGQHLQLAGWFDLSDIDHKEHSDVDAISFEDQALRVSWRTNADGEPGACVVVHKTGRLSTKPIPGVIPSLSLTPEDVHIVSQDTCSVAGQ
ncbi:hypothetical protein [Arthrobacter bambusae]|uniref:Uncharacterized protein n=1 Tax=Arthrobacter bambusae TaxID=1338426 RepID=A0AAW8DG13_9MICC|nr:hypothetical protein [Arthrobacter bambusae]MDP9905569.1 hypothetical protein [Arthrobacter bambusae]MDQ0127349.1 hypothetical protein [Arthrobacter bambusae]MDQ0178691.1 hypothetical protein [Arthrobacter bambusae]